MKGYMKGVSVIISWVLVIVIVVAGIGIVMLATAPTLNQAQSAAALAQAERIAAQLSNALASVSREGIGSSRIIQIPSTVGTWQLVPEEDLIEFRLPTSPLEPLVRRIRDNLVYISGFDASCSTGAHNGKPAWILENSYLKVYLQKINGTINTTQNILALQSKVTGVTIVPVDSSIQVDNDPATSSGTGFSTMRTGSLPKCRAHFFVNSTAGLSYDIFYTLYSGADFLVVEVRNIT